MEYIINLDFNDNNIHDFDKRNIFNKRNKRKNNKLIKVFKGIKILCRNYLLFLKGNTISVIHLFNLTMHNWGITMILSLGYIQTYLQIQSLSDSFANILKNPQ